MHNNKQPQNKFECEIVHQSKIRCECVIEYQIYKVNECGTECEIVHKSKVRVECVVECQIYYVNECEIKMWNCISK